MKSVRSTEPLWDTEGVAEYLGVPFHTVRAWRYRRPEPVGPPFVVIGRHKRYRRADVDAWLDAQVTPTARKAA